MSKRAVPGAVVALLVLAGCASQAPPAETEHPTGREAAVEVSESAEPLPSPDPDAPEEALIDEDDALAHKACALWMSSLDEDANLREVTEDVQWNFDHSENDFITGPLTGDDWVESRPEHVRILCEWNGYSTEEGSPAELLG